MMFMPTKIVIKGEERFFIAVSHRSLCQSDMSESQELVSERYVSSSSGESGARILRVSYKEAAGSRGEDTTTHK
eukprot:12886586-Prorocentrum_lima.AAC.1